MSPLFRRLSLILLTTFSLQSSAQNLISESEIEPLRKSVGLPPFDSLLLLRGNIQFYQVGLIWKKNFRPEKQDTLDRVFREIERLAISRKNPELEITAALWQIDIKLAVNSKAEPTTLERLIERAENSGVFWAEMEARLLLADFYLFSKNPARIESGVWILKENIAEITKKDDTNLARLLLGSYQRLIGHYYHVDNLSNAIAYSKKALAIEFPKGPVMVTGEPQIIPTLNNLGVFYREQQELDSSNFYFRKVLDITSKLNDTVYHAIASGNLGENFYLQGHHLEALPLLQVDVNESTEAKFWGNASNALILIADIYLTQGDLEMAKQVLDQAIIAADSSKDLKRLGKLYPFMSKYYRTIGQPELALAYADSTIVVMDSIKRQNNQFYGSKTEQLFNAYQLKIEAQEELKLQETAVKKRNIGLLVLLLFIISAYFIFRNYHLKAKLKESNLIREVEQAKDELTLTKEKLNNYIEEIISQNNSVDWKKMKINSDEQWEKFLELFLKVHPEFILRFKSNFPWISAGEIRLLCLSRVAMDDLDMASILGINVNSVSQTRRRFMRKANIENLKSLKELIFNI